MTTIQVVFLENCANDCAGEEKAIDIKRAQRLARIGYVRILDQVPEAAVIEPAESATKGKPANRTAKASERRG